MSHRSITLLSQLAQIGDVADDQKIVRRQHTFGSIQINDVLTRRQQVRRIEEVQARQVKID